MIRIIHSGNIGDIIYALPAMRSAAELHGDDGIHLFLLIDQPAGYAAGTSHPLGNVTLNRAIADMAIPLLNHIPFISTVEIITERPAGIDYDFDAFRRIGHTYTGSISRWYFHIYPQLTCDLSRPIDIALDDDHRDDTRPIVFNRTERYHGPAFDYRLVHRYSHLMRFVGLPYEYDMIKKKLPDMIYQPVTNFLELALIIRDSEFFIGNQSMAFAIAEIFKIPRAVEICRSAHNVIPCGEGPGYDLYDIQNLKAILDDRFTPKTLMTVSHAE